VTAVFITVSVLSVINWYTWLTAIGANTLIYHSGLSQKVSGDRSRPMCSS